MHQLNKMKGTIGRKKQMQTSESIISSLSHYVQTEKSKPQSTTKIAEDDEEEEITVTSNTDPFLEIKAIDANNRGRKILDYASDDDDDSESDTVVTLNNTFSNDIDYSDDDSIDSEDDDFLKHAGIFQIEEVVKISQEKMVKLQSLYIDQFQRLQKVLREKRRSYLYGVKREKEIYSNIFDQYRDSPRERKLYQKFKAMNHYHQRKHGVEAVLHKKFLEKRLQSELAIIPASLMTKNIQKCNFSDGVKCTEKAMPGNTRYCRKHIMEDKKQILFKICGIEKSGVVCQEPVMNVFEDSTCVLHTTLFTSPRMYVKRKYESETEEDDSFNLVKDLKLEESAEIKTEDEEMAPIEVPIKENVVDEDEIKIN